MNDWPFWLRLHLTPGLGRVGIFRLIEHFGSPADALAAVRSWKQVKGVRQDVWDGVPDEHDPRFLHACKSFEACHAQLLTFQDPDYPDLLKSIPDPPAILYVRGRLARARRRLAIIGSRQPTASGRRWTEQLAGELANLGIEIVSGLARGIDAAAHRGALRGPGGTVAVLGCGIDRIYPPEHDRLFRQIEEQGALLSEYPPGVEPLPGHFPGRNRIISGISQGVLVVEAARRSGSLITAEFALDQGREVLAVPGGLDRLTAAGTNQLIKDGAHPVTELADIMTLLWPDGCHSKPDNHAFDPPEPLSETARMVLGLLGSEPQFVDELAGKSGLTPMTLSAILLHLELQGGAESLPGARYIRGSKAPPHF